VHAPSSRARKGTEHVIAACERLGVELDLVEGLDHREAFERYRNADIVVDQLNAGWYGVFAIEAMALGKPVVTFLHDEAVRRTEEAFDTAVPVVSATAETLRGRLRPMVEDAAERRRLGGARDHPAHGDLERVLPFLLRFPRPRPPRRRRPHLVLVHDGDGDARTRPRHRARAADRRRAQPRRPLRQPRARRGSRTL